MSEPFNPGFVRRETEFDPSPVPPLPGSPPAAKKKGGRPFGSKNKVKSKPKTLQERIERTAGVTTYSPRVEIREADLPVFPDTPKLDKPMLRELPLPANPNQTPDAARSQGQFSLRRLIIQNYYTKKERRLSVPFHKNPQDYLDRSSEVLLKQEEAVYWSESQRDAELKAFATLIDPLAGNKSPHATKPPQDLVDSFTNSAE